MTDPAPPSEPPPPPPSGPGASPFRLWWESLRRSNDRLVGGVCGGIAASLGVPRALVIAAFALASIPLVGFVVYALLWVLVPDESGRRVREGDRWRDLLVASIVVAGIVVVLGVSVDSLIDNLLALAPWALVLGGVLLVVRRFDAPGGPQDPTTPTSTTPSSRATSSTEPSPTAVPSSTSVPSSTATPPSPVPPAPRYRQPLRLPVVGSLTWATALLTLAVLGLVALGDRGALGPGTMLTAVTVVFGAGLLASAFIGRARGLILPALAAVLGVLGLGVLDVRADNMLDAVDVRFRSDDELPERIEAGYGTSVIHLGELTLEGNRTLNVTQTAGVLWVMLPVETNADVSVEVKLGSADALRPVPTSDDFAAWLKSGDKPSTGDLLTRERAAELERWSPQTETRTAFDSRTHKLGTTAHFRSDVTADHTLTLRIEMGVGEVRIVDPRWESVPRELRTPTQACLDPAALTPSGFNPAVASAVPCEQIDDPAKQTALCWSDFPVDVGWWDNRIGDIGPCSRLVEYWNGDDMYEPLCFDWFDTLEWCDEVGVRPSVPLTPAGRGGATTPETTAPQMTAPESTAPETTAPAAPSTEPPATVAPTAPAAADTTAPAEGGN